MHKYVVSFLCLMIGWASIKAQAQEYLYLLNEGSTSYQGSIGRIHLANNQYEHLDSIATFGNDLKIYDQQIFVVDGLGDIKIYQKSPFQLQKTIPVHSARQVAKYQNQLVFTSSAHPYLNVYDLIGDSLLYSVDSNYIASTTEGLWIENDKAYVLVNGWGSDSALFVWNLASKTWVKTIPTALNPNDFAKVGNYLIFNCLDYMNGVTFQKLDLTTDSITQTFFTNMMSYGGLTAKSNQEVLFNFNAPFPSNIALWNLQTNLIDSNYVTSAGAYALYYHIPSSKLFYSITDFVSFGKVVIKSSSGSDTVNTHISPRRLVYDLENTTSIESKMAFTESKIYPNPAHEQVFFQLPNDFQNLKIYNMEGKKIYETSDKIPYLELQGWEKGVYGLVIQTQNGQSSHKLIIE